jgi:hypothetical protein
VLEVCRLSALPVLDITAQEHTSTRTVDDWRAPFAVKGADSSAAREGSAEDGLSATVSTL